MEYQGQVEDLTRKQTEISLKLEIQEKRSQIEFDRWNEFLPQNNDATSEGKLFHLEGDDLEDSQHQKNFPLTPNSSPNDSFVSVSSDSSTLNFLSQSPK